MPRTTSDGARDTKHSANGEPMSSSMRSRASFAPGEAIVFGARMTAHIDVLAGRDPHHVAESEFKAFARAFRDAVALDPRETGVPSTKGAL